MNVYDLHTAQNGSDIYNSHKKQSRLTLIFAVLISMIHFVFIMSYFQPAISTIDANGYYNQARLIATNLNTFFETESDVQHISPHWHHADNNRYYSTYPPGLPAIIAPIYHLFGPKAALLVNPIMASLSLIFLYLICRMWIGEWWGLLAAAFMAFNPVANQYALSSDSHTSTLFFLVCAFYFLIRWEHKHSVWSAFAVGFCLGIIPAIRYPEILFALAFVIFALLSFRKDRSTLYSFAAALIGFILPLIALLIRNHLAFGAFWRTGYGLMPMALEPRFGWSYFTRYAFKYLQKLQGEGVGLMFGFGIAGIALMFSNSLAWKRGVFLAMIIVPVTLLYMSYFWSPDFMSIRFLLPTFPIYILAGTWFLNLVVQQSRKAAVIVTAILILFAASWGIPVSMASMGRLKTVNEPLAKITKVLKEQVDPGNVVIANGNIQQHLEYIGLWRLASMYNRRDDRMMPFQIFGNEAQRDMMRTRESRTRGFINRSESSESARQMMIGRPPRRLFNSKAFESFNAYSAEIHRWAGENRKAYLIMSDNDFNFFKKNIVDGESLTVITSIEFPKPEAPINQRLEVSAPLLLPDGDPSEDTRRTQFNDMMNRDQRSMQRRFDFIMSDETLLLVMWSWINR